MRRLFVSALLALAAFPGTAWATPLAKADKPATAAAPAPPKIKVGDMAPDFTLLDTAGKAVSLHDFRGKKNVALAFYIFAFTGG